MFDQFFAKPFWLTLSALAGLFVLSVFAYAMPALAGIVLLISTLGIAVVSWKHPEIGIAAAFAELFANSHGHLISYPIGGFSISLRMALFLGVMLAWIVSFLVGRTRISYSDFRLYPFIPVFAAVLLGFAVGFLQNDPLTAFQDGNAYMYLGYLFPILSIEWNSERKRLILQVVAAAAIWICILTLGLLFVFTHFPEWMLGPTYRFIRDTRTGELTKMAGVLFRVFLQAQMSAVLLSFLVASFLFVRNVGRRTWWSIILLYSVLISVILISLSRSFWVGIVAGVLTMLSIVTVYARPTFRTATIAVGSISLATILSLALLAAIVLFPYPYRVGRVGDLTGVLSDRTTNLSDVAISSRWNLLPPLLDEVRSSPLLGSGFGEEVTFKTDDPRARAINPDGTWTTYAFEWGWLELWLKMGLLGPLSFLLMLIGLIRGMWPYLRTDRSWIGIGFIASFVMLYATHVFSPYLNHPLGLGILLLAVPFLKQNPPIMRSEAVVVDPIAVPLGIQESAAPSMSE